MPSSEPHTKVAKRLYVISDLHLGGAYSESNSGSGRGFRICTHVRELVAFIRAITARAVRTSIDTELVINGDIVDFLAETREVRDPASGKVSLGWQPFVDDPFEAIELFRRIVRRDNDFFVALKELLAADIRLTITLGNHDIELSFPAVRRLLVDELDADGRRFSIIYDGEAYRVGGVLIEHGNRYDEWNAVSHDGLRRIRSVQSRGEPTLVGPRGFEAPAGSFLVAGVMNEIKTRYPFIDLLKPESEAALPILIALAPEYRERIATIAGLIARSRNHLVGADGLPSNIGDISEQQGFRPSITGKAVIDEILRSKHMNELLEEDPAIEQDASALAEREVGLGDIGGQELRSLWSILKLILARKADPVSIRLPMLLKAMMGVRDDFSFDRRREVSQYRAAAERLLSYGSKVILFGHTHLAKQIEFDGGLYINTGTWADLLPFPSTILGSDAELTQSLSNDEEAAMLSRLAQFVDDMSSARLQEYLRFVPTYARIELDERGEPITARLCDYDGDVEDI